MPNSKNIRCSVCVALKVAALAIAALAGPLAWAQTTSPEPQLFEIQVSDLAVENGKKLNARFSEIERGDDYSVVEYQVKSGGSVSSSMFPIRAACALLKECDKPFLLVPVDAEPERDPGGIMKGRMRLEFPKVRQAPATDTSKGLNMSREECRLMMSM